MIKKFLFGSFLLLMVFGGVFYFKTLKKSRLLKSHKPVDSKTRDIILGKLNFKKYPKKGTDLKQYVEKQWALKDIGVLKAWEETKGSSHIVVAVCDTGLHPRHPCLAPNLWVNKGEIPDNGLDDDRNGYTDDVHGWNFVENSNDIQDRHGHGTHISGLIAATGKTNKAPECRMIGVAPRVKIMTLKYYDVKNSGNNVGNTVKCIDYAVANGAHIINYSGGGPGANEEERAAISRANDKGVLLIAASGNESSEIEKQSKYYPASYNLPNIISVNSKSPQGKILESSNWVKMEWRKKDKIHNQTAPGERIYSTLPPRRYLQSSLLTNVFRSLARAEPVKHNNYGYMTGTSQATGFATGVAALIKSRYPHLSHLQIIKRIDKTGFSGSAQNIKQKTNQGKTLNAHEAITMRDQDSTPTDSPKPVGPEVGDESALDTRQKDSGFDSLSDSGKALDKLIPKDTTEK